MKAIYTEYLPNREVRFSTKRSAAYGWEVTEDWPPEIRMPRVEILSDGQVWLYHELDGVFAWSTMRNLDEALRWLVEFG